MDRSKYEIHPWYCYLPESKKLSIRELTNIKIDALEKGLDKGIITKDEFKNTLNWILLTLPLLIFLEILSEDKRSINIIQHK